MESELIPEVLSDAEDRMKKALGALSNDFAAVRTGRASAALVEKLPVDYYGTKTPLYQLATITVPEPQLVVIQPWDKSATPAIEKAVMQSELGLNPANDGAVIRVPFPPLTEERRHDLVKMVKRMAEDARVAVRNIRRDANETLREMQHEKEISEDEQHRASDQVQKLTDTYVGKVDDMVAHNEQEVMEV